VDECGRLTADEGPRLGSAPVASHVAHPRGGRGAGQRAAGAGTAGRHRAREEREIESAFEVERETAMQDGMEASGPSSVITRRRLERRTALGGGIPQGSGLHGSNPGARIPRALRVADYTLGAGEHATSAGRAFLVNLT
jgi:hypothetical protein